MHWYNELKIVHPVARNARYRSLFATEVKNCHRKSIEASTFAKKLSRLCSIVGGSAVGRRGLRKCATDCRKTLASLYFSTRHSLMAE